MILDLTYVMQRLSALCSAGILSATKYWLGLCACHNIAFQTLLCIAFAQVVFFKLVFIGFLLSTVQVIFSAVLSKVFSLTLSKG